jgi:hypothetical protein
MTIMIESKFLPFKKTPRPNMITLNSPPFAGQSGIPLRGFFPLRLDGARALLR